MCMLVLVNRPLDHCRILESTANGHSLVHKWNCFDEVFVSMLIHDTRVRQTFKESFLQPTKDDGFHYGLHRVQYVFSGTFTLLARAILTEASGSPGNIRVL